MGISEHSPILPTGQRWGRATWSSGRCPSRDRHVAAAAVLAVAVVVFAVSTWAYTRLPAAMRPRPTPQALAPGHRWLQAWSWWDGAWYVHIARYGYHFVPGRQSSVAFFPAYPLLIRALSGVVGDAVMAGFLVTLTCGVAAALLFHRWSVEHFGPDTARHALAALLLYPCSFYLFGAIYADALLLVAVLASFLLLEHDRPLLAGIAGAVATAARPSGIALVIGLWVRAVERRGRTTAGLLLAPAGLVLYCLYLWAKAGSPLAFVAAETGWHQTPGLRTWLKVSWLHGMLRPPYLDPPHAHLVGNAFAAVVALSLVPAVFRRLGRGYGVYVLTLLAGSALSTKNFVGMGRYALAAFPCFAVVGDRLAERRSLRWAVLATSALLLVSLTELHARNMLIS